MSAIRVNLRVTKTNSPKLFNALSDRPPRERGEFVRQTAERGIQIGNNVFVVSQQENCSSNKEAPVLVDIEKSISPFPNENSIDPEALTALCDSFS